MTLAAAAKKSKGETGKETMRVDESKKCLTMHQSGNGYNIFVQRDRKCEHCTPDSGTMKKKTRER